MMRQMDKELLLKDVLARIPYGVKATTTSNGWNNIYTITGYANDRIYLDCPVYDKGDDEWLVEFVKPYLRPMSSMTEDERKDWFKYSCVDYDCEFKPEPTLYVGYCHLSVEWLNEHHFDYRGLIEKCLALEAPEGMYNIKKK